jgi:hypothetical protein
MTSHATKYIDLAYSTKQRPPLSSLSDRALSYNNRYTTGSNSISDSPQNSHNIHHSNTNNIYNSEDEEDHESLINTKDPNQLRSGWCIFIIAILLIFFIFVNSNHIRYSWDRYHYGAMYHDSTISPHPDCCNAPCCRNIS